MLRKFTVILTIFLFIIGTGYSQERADSLYKNALKVNVAAGAFKKLTMSYERDINERWSTSLAAGYKFGGTIPKFIGLGDFMFSSKTAGLRGFSFTPDVKYHFQNCECGGHTGLYAGAYLSATRLYGEFDFRYWTGTEFVDVSGHGSLQEFGIGLEVGYQFVFKERWIVDLMFMGPRTSFQHLKAGIDSDYADEIVPIIEEEINKRLAWWGMDPITINPGAEVEANFRFNNFRYAISVGFLF
jgi:uncharacterized protein DUF3575